MVQLGPIDWRFPRVPLRVRPRGRSGEAANASWWRKSLPRFELLLVPALVAIMLGVACGGDSPKAPTPPAASESGFLVTSPSGILEMADSHPRVVIPLDDESLYLDPAISRDGTMIAFSRQAPASRDKHGNLDFGSDLMIADRETGKVRELVRHGAVGEFIRTPAFLQSEELLFGVQGRTETGAPDMHIDRVDLSSGERTRLIDNASHPAVTPDDKNLAYVSHDVKSAADSIVIRDLLAGKERDLVPASAQLVLIQSLAWSPDGSLLAFAASDFTGSVSSVPSHPTLQDLWLVGADGSGLTRLAEVAETGISIAWAGDGSAIYVMAAGAFSRFDVRTGDREELAAGVPSGQIARLP